MAQEEKKLEERDLKVIDDKMNEFMNLDTKLILESFLENNELEFEIRKIKYKIRKLNFKEKQELNRERIRKYNELLKAKDDTGKFIFNTESDLIKIYKERGIDIDEMTNKFNLLAKKKDDYDLKLGQMLKENKPEIELEVFKKEIEKIKEEQKSISIKKTTLLDSTLEMQLLIFVYSYIAYLVTEKSVEDKWVRAFNNYKEFEETDNGIIDDIIYNISLISGLNF